MKIKAYPKVNLCLKVYKGLVETKHKIDSVMFLYKKIYDVIYIKKSFDLCVFYKENGIYDELSKHILATAKRLNIKLTWGGSWKTLVDKPHYELG